MLLDELELEEEELDEEELLELEDELVDEELLPPWQAAPVTVGVSALPFDVP